MTLGEVFINFNELKKDYPLTVGTISEMKVTHCEVYKEDNEYYDPDEKEIRIRLYYRNNKDKNEDYFTLLLQEKYLFYVQ